MSTCFDMQKYKSFDPMMIIQMMISKTVAEITQINWTNESSVPPSMRDRVQNMDWTEQVCFLLVLFMSRGSKISKIVQRSEREMVQVTKAQTDHFQIKDTGGKQKSQNIITIPRLAEAFAPSWTTELFRQLEKIGSNVPDELDKVIAPRVCRCPVIGGLLTSVFRLSLLHGTWPSGVDPPPSRPNRKPVKRTREPAHLETIEMQ